MAPGVREKRGTGLDWITPSCSTYERRALRCGCSLASLRGNTGRLDVKWELDGLTLQLDWRETVTPFTPPTDRRGFGTTVLESMVGRSLGAHVERTVHDDGLEWRFAVPISAIDPSKGPEEAGDRAG